MTTEDTTLGAQALPCGIGGWLIVLAVGMVLAPVNAALNLLGVWQDNFASGFYGALTTPGSPDFHPMWRGVLLTELGYHVLMVPVLIWLAVLFFCHSRHFPRGYLLVTGLSAVYLMLDYVVVKSLLPMAPVFDDAMLKTVVGLAVALGLWAPYLFLSDRARCTFIR